MIWCVISRFIKLPSQVWRQFWSFPRTLPRQASPQSQSRQTPDRCWWTLRSRLHSSANRTEVRHISWLYKQRGHFCTSKGAFFTIRFALAIWCFISPPPKMIIPVLLANTAWLFNLRISVKKFKFTIRPNMLKQTPLPCFVMWCWFLTLHYVQNQAGVLKRVEVDHVSQRAISESRTEDWNIILMQDTRKWTNKQNKQTKQRKHNVYLSTTCKIF